MSACLALAASLFWGASDFLGGRLSRRLPPATVIALSQLIAAALLLGWLSATGGWRTDAAPAGLAVAAGLLWVTGVGAFYQALAKGVMGVVAPIASSGMAVPVLVGMLGGERPRPAQLVGIAGAAAGVFCCSGPQRSGQEDARAWRPLLLAGLAALAFGGEIALLARTGNASIPLTMALMRVTAVVIVAAVVLRRARSASVAGSASGRVRRRDLPALAVLGVLDIAAMAAFLLSSRHGALTLVAVLASLYPAVTVLLARRLDHERLRPVQAWGLLVTLLGAACLAASGVTA